MRLRVSAAAGRPSSQVLRTSAFCHLGLVHDAAIEQRVIDVEMIARPGFPS